MTLPANPFVEASEFCTDANVAVKLGQITMPEHHLVGSSMLSIIPSDFMRCRSASTRGISGRGTRRRAARE